MMGIGFPEITGLILPFAFVGFIIWLVLGRRRDRISKHAEVQKEIISKFSTSAEMHEFLKSKEGQALFKSVASSGDAYRSPRDRAISRMNTGIVLTIVGGGLSILAHYADRPQFLVANVAPPPAPLIDLPPGMGAIGVPLFLAGIGLLISALATFRLTNRDPKPE